MGHGQAGPRRGVDGTNQGSRQHSFIVVFIVLVVVTGEQKAGGDGDGVEDFPGVVEAAPLAADGRREGVEGSGDLPDGRRELRGALGVVDAVGRQLREALQSQVRPLVLLLLGAAVGRDGRRQRREDGLRRQQQGARRAGEGREGLDERQSLVDEASRQQGGLVVVSSGLGEDDGAGLDGAGVGDGVRALLGGLREGPQGHEGRVGDGRRQVRGAVLGRKGNFGEVREGSRRGRVQSDGVSGGVAAADAGGGEGRRGLLHSE
mmetsp:Transcript_34205/g.109852  ORF Transcript_34205/g.109852 Transcript_34205/m.109852 type:complete len:262 (+) Transcript_34205:3132-3917(+)